MQGTMYIIWTYLHNQPRCVPLFSLYRGQNSGPERSHDYPGVTQLEVGTANFKPGSLIVYMILCQASDTQSVVDGPVFSLSQAHKQINS